MAIPVNIPHFCKKGMTHAKEFINLIAYYDNLNDANITTRALSIACFSNSKRFEHEFQDDFLRLLSKIHPDLKENTENATLTNRDKLAVLGIFSYQEYYPLSGCFTIRTTKGDISFASTQPYGLAIPGSVTDNILSIDFQAIKKIILIENMTNYNEYLHTEVKQTELIIYHGGFLSPQKQKFLQKLSASVPADINVFFWADIDIGGFRMFNKLSKIFSNIVPMRMSENEVKAYVKYGLTRENPYLKKLEALLECPDYHIFTNTIKMILKYRVTIEQEVFLLDN